MKAIDFEVANVQIAEKQDEYVTLPANVLDDGTVTICWKLTWKERFKLLFTGKLWHMILTFNRPLQPILLTTDTPHHINEQIEQSKEDTSTQ